ncbi:MAG: type I glutamate--ammonia ligase [Chloroflexi bacterium]|nr:type I glutamate--ammonia ligase [Chloroflexota bacterium]
MVVSAAKGKTKPQTRIGDEVFEAIKRDKVKYIDLQFTDLPGRLQHVTIPIDQLEPESFTEGVPKLDGSSIRGFVEIQESDMMLRPDPATYAVIPWIPDHIKTARMICDVLWGFGQGRFSRDPRAIAQKAEEVVKEMGLGVSIWGPEIEFFVFDKVHWDVMEPYKGTSYSIESKEAAWNGGPGYPIRFKEGYFPATPQDTLMDYRSECATTLGDRFGVRCDAHHHEVATAGQCEIDMYRDTLTKMADNVMTYKFVIKNLAAQKGMIATVMPKPVFMDNASGMHVHVSLWKGDDNLFYDPKEPYAELSQLAKYFGGGLMKHSRSLTAITNPTTNSFRRLVPGYEAPVFIAWSRRNRSANVRVPVYQKGPSNKGRKRLEFRTPDPSANPYLCFAAILAAGLDGVKNKIDIGSPVDEDIYKLSPQRRRELGVGELPGSLKEAAQCLEEDHAYLKPIFPDDAIERIIEDRLADHLQLAIRPHPYEFHLYFDL